MSDQFDELGDFEFTAEDCVRWSEKLDRLSLRFLKAEDFEHARLMYVCAGLMSKLAFEVEVETTGGIFPVKVGGLA